MVGSDSVALKAVAELKASGHREDSLSGIHEHVLDVLSILHGLSERGSQREQCVGRACQAQRWTLYKGSEVERNSFSDIMPLEQIHAFVFFLRRGWLSRGCVWQQRW